MTETTDSPAPTVGPACDECATGGTLTSKGLCCRDFRNALGRFATGVTVVTALNAEGKPIGVTISSFNSVSLDPPLVLWSLSTNSPKLEAFRQASHYAINVLAADQRGLSNRFASRAEDRFADVPVRRGQGGTPLIEGCCAWFECTHEAHYPGGDHIIFVGRVEGFARGEATSPLVFFDGAYCWVDMDETD